MSNTERLENLVFEALTGKSLIQYDDLNLQYIYEDQYDFNELKNSELNYFIQAAYKIIYKRRPSFYEKNQARLKLNIIGRRRFLCDLDKMSQGRNLGVIKNLICYEYGYAFVIDDFMIAENDIEFIENAYLGILKRMPDMAGRDHYLNLLSIGKYSRRDVVINIYESVESKKIGVSLSY